MKKILCYLVFVLFMFFQVYSNESKSENSETYFFDFENQSENQQITSENSENQIENESSIKLYDSSQIGKTVNFGLFKIYRPCKDEKQFYKDVSLKIKSFGGSLGFKNPSKLERNSNEIINLSLQANPLWRENFYKKNKMNYGALEIAEQIAYGFGVINFSQDDYLFGALFAVADVSSVALLTIGVLNASIQGDPTLFVLSNLIPIVGPILYLSKYGDFEFDKFIPFGISALAIKAVSATLSILRSSSRAKKWNSGLSEVLLLDSDGKQLSLEPIVNPLNNEMGLALCFKF